MLFSIERDKRIERMIYGELEGPEEETIAANDDVLSQNSVAW
jgi:hypothetical protein